MTTAAQIRNESAMDALAVCAEFCPPEVEWEPVSLADGAAITQAMALHRWATATITRGSTSRAEMAFAVLCADVLEDRGFDA